MIAGGSRPVAPYSHAVEADGWVFVTGQLANDPVDDSRPFPPDVEGQTRRVMENLRIVLAGIGLGFEHVVMARVFLTDFKRDYARMNKVYQGYFAPGKLPARTCIGVTGLARDGLVEIDLIARRP
ncbi:MAG: RidA family protein [Alphaproteobacteria bacterium]|nr:RidA family protein [Alphaproteobacteria bacterium]